MQNWHLSPTSQRFVLASSEAVLCAPCIAQNDAYSVQLDQLLNWLSIMDKGAPQQQNLTSCLRPLALLGPT